MQKKVNPNNNLLNILFSEVIISMNKALKCLVVVLLLGLTACAQKDVDYVISEESDNIGSECTEELFYTSEFRFESRYISYDFHEYKMFIDVDKTENYKIHALNVAKLAYMLAYDHKISGMPNNDKVVDILSNGHFVVVEDDHLFEQLYTSDRVPPSQVGAFIDIGKDWACWESPAETKWSSIIRAKLYSALDPDVIVHEMIHAVSYATYGDSDANHSNELLWDELGEDTLQSRVLGLYDMDFIDSNPLIHVEQRNQF